MDNQETIIPATTKAPLGIRAISMMMLLSSGITILMGCIAILAIFARDHSEIIGMSIIPIGIGIVGILIAFGVRGGKRNARIPAVVLLVLLTVPLFWLAFDFGFYVIVSVLALFIIIFLTAAAYLFFTDEAKGYLVR